MDQTHAKCQECGALVENRPQHQNWHTKLNHDQRKIENAIRQIQADLGELDRRTVELQRRR
jgi:hypothetical protein